LQRLNGKLLPFLEFNRRRFPGLTVQDYLDLEAMRRTESIEGMFRVNTQAVRGTFDVGGGSRVSRAFGRVVCAMQVDSI
jgi:hypothetical protein